MLYIHRSFIRVVVFASIQLHGRHHQPSPNQPILLNRFPPSWLDVTWGIRERERTEWRTLSLMETWYFLNTSFFIFRILSLSLLPIPSNPAFTGATFVRHGLHRTSRACHLPLDSALWPDFLIKSRLPTTSSPPRFHFLLSSEICNGRHFPLDFFRASVYTLVSHKRRAILCSAILNH